MNKLLVNVNTNYKKMNIIKKWVIDIAKNKILGFQRYKIKTNIIDTKKVDIALSNINI